MRPPQPRVVQSATGRSLQQSSDRRQIFRNTDRMKAESTQFTDLEALICSKPINCAR